MSSRVSDARALQRAQPHAVGPLLRLFRVLLEAGQKSEALRFAHRYGESYGVGAKGGEALLALVSRAPVLRCADRDVIVQEGDPSDGIFVLLEGRAIVERAGTGFVARLEAGASFGEIGLCAGISRTATVASSGPSKLLEISRTRLTQVRAYFPPLVPMLRAIYRDRLMATLIPPGSVFSDLTAEQRHQLFPRFVPGTVEAGKTILQEGEAGKGFCVIVSGRAEVWRRGVGGRGRNRLALLGPSDYFGEISLTFDVPVTANVEALSTIAFFALRRDDFKAVLNTWPAQMEKMIALARQRMGYQAQGPTIDLMPDRTPVRFLAPPGVMTCPSCGFDQPEAPSCVSCGANVERERLRIGALPIDVDL